MGEMDPRRVLLFLSLLACAFSASPPSFQNGRDGSDLIRHTRRIGLNEYLVPPPLPKFAPSRNPRLAPPAEQSGYFSKLMSWLNPFNYISASPSPPPSPSLPRLEPPQPPHQRYIQPPPPPPPPPPSISGISASGYGDLAPPVYDRPPLPPIFNNHAGYRAPKTCNPCNKVPWVPVNGEASHHHSADASFIAPPSSPPLQSPPSSGGYLPPSNPGAHDAYHAASQEVRAPDLTFASALPTAVQSVPSLNSLPNPQLYPGATPPLFKATDFTYPVQPTLNGIPEYLDAPPPSANYPLAGSGGYSGAVGSAPNGGHVEQPLYANNPSAHSSLGGVHQDLGYTGVGVSNNGLELSHVQSHGGQGDLFSSGTQVSHGQVDSVLGVQGFGNIATQHASFDNSVIGDHQAAGVPNNGALGIHGSNGLGPGDLLDNSSQIVPGSLSSYGISGLGRTPDNYEHRYNDLSSSSSVVTDSHAPLRTTDGSPAKIEDPIHFEQSPLLDLTHKGESRTDSSPIPPTSNALADFNESTNGSGATTLAPGLEFFGAHIPAGSAPTESRFPADGVLKTVQVSGSLEKSNSIDDSSSGQVANGIHDSVNPPKQKVSYFHSLSQSLAGYLRSDVSTTTSRSTEKESFWGSLTNVYDSVLGHQAEQSDENADVDFEDTNETGDLSQQSPKRNKKVQVIIPYTSKHTPVPFQPVREQNYGRKVVYASDSSRDNYISEESRNKIKVTELPNSFHNSHAWPVTVAISEEVTGKPAGTKVNNSIDVHRLQKNIDNWTIQEYSRGTTASTVSPSSAKPYLFPSKQIPDKYLTTTEPINHADDSRHENIKTFTLGGFSFNDQEHEGSSSNRVEIPRIQIITGNRDHSKVTTEGPVTIVTARTTNGIAWQAFPMEISPVSKERVYVVTPQPTVTTPRMTMKKNERNPKESTETSETGTRRTETNTDPFESIEKAYQVLPQAVNNLAVASTGPDRVPLWGIMEHEEFGSLGDSDHDDHDDPEDHEDSEPEVPVLYGGHSKVSRARR